MRAAAARFADDLSRSGRIEWVYHRLCSDPDGGAIDLEKLEDPYALAAALRELEETHLVQGRARVWVLMVMAWARVSRGETAQLGDVASEALRLAHAAGNAHAQAVADALLGDVFQAQRKLSEAQAAFEEYLAISRRLAEHDPSNSAWQRELAVAHSRVGDVLEAQGKLSEAQAVFAEYLAISRLAEQDPSNAGWQRELAMMHSRIGGVFQAQDKLAEPQAAHLAISRRLAEQDPSNSGLQRDLRLARWRMARLWSDKGTFSPALPLYDETSRILCIPGGAGSWIY